MNNIVRNFSYQNIHELKIIKIFTISLKNA